VRSSRSPRSIHTRVAAHRPPAAAGTASWLTGADATGGLPRRQPGARLPGDAYRATPTHAAPDEALLLRIRIALDTLR
jgi:hypothetical protein